MAERFEKPYLILCEGRGDQRFFGRLFAARAIPDIFSISVPLIGDQYAGGRPNFGRYLSSISVDETFIQNVKGVLVVSDNDSSPEQSFTEVREQIEISGLPVPNAVQTVHRAPNQPAVVVLMLPIGEPGNLESVCLDAAYSKWGLRNELAEFVDKTLAKDWEIGKQAKMKMQTILAATNDRQPDTGFGGHWNQPEEYRTPLDHPCFDDITTFLMGFQALVEA